MLGLFAFGIAVGSLSGCCLWAWQGGRVTDVSRSLDRAITNMGRNAKADALARAAVPLTSPWWTHLPGDSVTALNGQDLLTSEAMAAASGLNVQVLRMSFSPLPLTTGAPYSGFAVQVELGGAYSDIKLWLAEVLSRRPHELALRKLDMRRAAQSIEQPAVEASIELRLFERTDQLMGRPRQGDHGNAQ